MQGAILLVNWLPGKLAVKYRKKATQIILRFIAGDATLIAEIETNAASNNPITQIAKDHLSTLSSNTQNIELSLQHQKQIQDMEIEEKRLTVEGLAIANRLSEAQTILIERQNQEEVYAVAAGERTRPVQKSLKPINGGLSMFVNMFLSGIINSKPFMLGNRCHYTFSWGADKYVNVYCDEIYKHFVRFLQVNDYKFHMPKKAFIHDVMKHAPGFKKSSGTVKASYNINCDKLQIFLVEQNQFDPEIVF